MTGTARRPPAATPRGERYTHGHNEPVMRSHMTRTAANSAAYLVPHLRPGASLLDVGCGPGTITADLAALVAPGRVVALDPSPEARAATERAVAGRGLHNVSVVSGDVYALDHPDHTFSVVHAHQVLQHLADPVAALREMRRVCAPGGLVAARDGDYSTMTWYPESAALADWLSVYQRVARRNGGEPDAGRRLLAWARRAGFTDVVSTASSWCYATPEARATWSGTWADRILGTSLGDQAVAYGYATVADLERISAGWRAWGAAPDGWFAVLHGEIVCRA
jgi:ubiquinone/menaquinone biosynthesis C-methylase UbiE